METSPLRRLPVYDFLMIKLWWVIHNLVAHPLLVTGCPWATRFHDWTAERMGPEP